MDITGLKIKRIEFNWWASADGERVMHYDIETNADEIEEGKDGWFYIKTKEGEIHKITNINTIMYERPETPEEQDK